MMTAKKIDIYWFCTSVFSFFLMSASFLFMSVESSDDSLSAISVASGIAFWLFLIIGTVAQIVLSVRRKKWFKNNKIRGIRSYKGIGVFSFFRNTYATVADICSVVSLIALIITTVLTKGTSYFCYILLSVFVFSFVLHCVFNGKIFYHINNQEKLVQALEKKR